MIFVRDSEEIVSDNRAQFVVQEVKDYLKFDGIRQCLSSPYPPSSNRKRLSVLLGTFKESTKTMKKEPGTLAEILARFLLGYQATPQSATGCTLVEILMVKTIQTRLDLIHPTLPAKISG